MGLLNTGGRGAPAFVIALSLVAGRKERGQRPPVPADLRCDRSVSPSSSPVGNRGLDSSTNMGRRAGGFGGADVPLCARAKE